MGCSRPIHRRIAALGLAATLCAACSSTPRQEPEPDSAARDLVSQARKLDLAGRQPEAIALYRQALERDADSFDGQYGIARALDLAGDYDEARQHFTKAIELAPESSRDQALRMMGVAWTFVGNVDEASRYFRQVFDRRVAENNPSSAAEVANELGRVYLESGDLDRAEEWYRRGHDMAARAPDRPTWQIDLADMRWAHAQARIAARRGRAADARAQAAVVKRLLDKGGNETEQVQYRVPAGLYRLLPRGVSRLD